MFPSGEDRLDLPCISKLCRKGRYDNDDGGGSCIGITVLFDDLQKMVQQSKRFNACNRSFLPWRQADMMEQAVLTLKARLAEHHALPSLQSALQQDLANAEEDREEAMPVEL